VGWRIWRSLTCRNVRLWISFLPDWARYVHCKSWISWTVGLWGRFRKDLVGWQIWRSLTCRNVRLWRHYKKMGIKPTKDWHWNVQIKKRSSAPWISVNFKSFKFFCQFLSMFFSILSICQFVNFLSIFVNFFKGLVFENSPTSPFYLSLFHV
jgi:hypothetical protein